jgi:hypothetical protein
MLRHETQETLFMRVVYPGRFVPWPNVEIILEHNVQCRAINADVFHCHSRKSGLLISSIHALLRLSQNNCWFSNTSVLWFGTGVNHVNARTVFDKAVAECNELKRFCLSNSETHFSYQVRAICQGFIGCTMLSLRWLIICEGCSNEARSRRC